MNLLDLKVGNRIYRLGENGGFLIYEDMELKQDTLYVVCPYGIGDTLYVASLIESLKGYRSIDKVCLIVKKAHYQIPDWFDAVDEKIVSDEMVNVLNIFSIISGTWELNNYLYGHFHKNNNGALLPEYAACEVKNMIYRYKRLVFNIPIESPLEEPKIMPQGDILEKVLENCEIGERTIILMPYANSTNLISGNFWEMLAKLLEDLGYVVFTNVRGDDEPPIRGTRGLCVDIATMAALCERCRLVISLRSGICDVLAFTETNLIVLNKSEYHLNEWNLKAVTDREHIYSFLMGSTDIGTAILEILGYSL